MSTHRNWCFTINNPTTSQLFVSETQIKLCTASLEVGESGTVHYQGYVELKSNRSMNQVKNLFTDQSVHLEARRGSKQQAMEYSLKTYMDQLKQCQIYATSSELERSITSTTTMDSTLSTVIIKGYDGTCSDLVNNIQEKKTKKQRLQIIQTQIKEGKTELAIAEEDFELWVKYQRAFSHYRLLCSEPRNQKTKIIVVQGPTGSGKSYWCRQRGEEQYWKPRNQWWDGYNGQTQVVFDEFYGWIPFDLLLRLGDEYPLQVEIKGGSVNFNSKYLYITTNKRPDTWYKEVYFQAFIRRVEYWVVINNRDDIIYYQNYNEVNWAQL